MTSSTKLEIPTLLIAVLMEEDRVMAIGNADTHTQNLVTFAHMVSEKFVRMDIQTDRHVHHNTLLMQDGVIAGSQLVIDIV